MMNRLYYFTIEDESILAEAFAQFEKDVYAITYKVAGTEDVFVTTSETKDAMDRHDIPYNLLAEEDGAKIAVYHSPLSREELGDYRGRRQGARPGLPRHRGRLRRGQRREQPRLRPLERLQEPTPTSPPPPATPSSGACSASATRRSSS